MSNSSENEQIKKLEVTLYQTRSWLTIACAVAFAVIAAMVGNSIRNNRENAGGPWYLGCADRTGKELLLETDKKPRIEGGLIFLEDDMFVTPLPGMTCRVVSVEDIESTTPKVVDDSTI